MGVPRVLRSVAPPLRTQTPVNLAVRKSKVLILRAKRLAQWARSPGAFPQAPHASTCDRVLLHEIVVDAHGEQSHPRLEIGKLRNLRVAAAHFDGRLLTPQCGFSFWRLLGRPTVNKGFLPGTEIRDGCVVPTVGGGLCMLSGALFRLAAEMDWVIQERHGHTIAPNDLSRIDATVFWPFVDLRFAPREGAAVLRVRVAGGQLRVAVYGDPQEVRPRLRVWRQAREAQSNVRTSRILRSKVATMRVEVLGRDSQRVLAHGLRRNCLTCEERNCHAREGVLEAL